MPPVVHIARLFALLFLSLYPPHTVSAFDDGHSTPELVWNPVYVTVVMAEPGCLHLAIYSWSPEPLRAAVHLQQWGSLERLSTLSIGFDFIFNGRTYRHQNFVVPFKYYRVRMKNVFKALALFYVYHTHTRTHIHTCTHAHAHMHTFTRIYTHAHTHIHTCTHTERE